MNRFGHARGARRLGALLLLLVLLPGWTLPPECAACPHAADSEGHAPVHISGMDEVLQDDHSVHGHRSVDEHRDAAPERHDGDCGCPCDVQCAAVQIAPPATIEVSSGDTPDAPSARMVPTRLRPAAPPFPPHFLPLSNGPPR